MKRFLILSLSIGFACVTGNAQRGGGRGGAGAAAAANTETEDGIAVTDALTISKCGT